MKKILLISAVILFLGSCKKDMSMDTAPQSDATLKAYAAKASDAYLSYKAPASLIADALLKNDKQVGKPLKSSGSGTISYVPGGCGPETLQLISNGTGHSTHLGAFTQTVTVCLGSNGFPVAPIIGTGKAANGDSLIYAFTGQGANADGVYYQTYVIIGGSGRFTNASGSMTLTYQVNELTHFSYTGEGTIVY